MSDQHLRELERAALGGHVDDRARLLRERVRTGGLTRERLELAAWCEDPRALLLTGYLVEQALVPWLKYLSRWPDAPLRAAIAAAWVVVRDWRCEMHEVVDLGEEIETLELYEAVRHEDFDAPEDDGPCVECRAPGLAVAAAEAWVVCPCQQHQGAWVGTFDRIRSRPVIWVPSPASPHRFASDVVRATEFADEQDVRTAISRELISWSLGEGDPIKKRVEARLSEPCAMLGRRTS